MIVSKNSTKILIAKTNLKIFISRNRKYSNIKLNVTHYKIIHEADTLKCAYIN